MSDQARILVVEDEVNIRTALVALLEKRGFAASAAASGEEALARLEGEPADLVITDLKMPSLGGLELLRRVKAQFPDVEVLVTTAYGSIETAVEAMRAGAYDYLTKPIDRERFPVTVEKALERRALAAENRRLRDRLETRMRFDAMVGDSEPMQRVFGLMEMIASSDATVLLVGESGTGKELVARAIHERSPRSGGPFVSVNCGALPENLLESELFGYEKGAFTGAVGTKVGRFELADGGTLFLDEVGELSPKSQVDFLRVLETREFRRLGGTRLVKVDVRFIAATNRNLEAAVQEGRFREDLYYRLNVVPVRLPPLRDRGDDLPLLIARFLREFAERHHREPKEMSREALRVLRRYPWPGNIRQLRNVIERVVVTVPDRIIQPVHLPEEIQAGAEAAPTLTVPLGCSLEDIEREVIRRTLSDVTHHRERAAKLLGISLRTLQYKIKAYGIRD
jgi:DNA-binding NtrC family response regulator